MNVERQLQINMAALAALGTLLLGMGQQSAWLPLFAAIAVVVSVYVTDIAKLFQLNRHLANVAAIAALVVSLREFQLGGSETQLLVIANLLIYLQVVLVFQRKNDRVYWLLAVLSLLQVVVAAALNLGFAFGLLLVVYLVVALSALFLFFLHRETRLGRESEEEETVIAAEGAAASPDLGWPWQWLAMLGSSDGGEARPALAAGEEGFEQAVVYRDPNGPPALRAFPGWSMVREVAGLTLSTLILTSVIFYSVPRYGDSTWRWGTGPRVAEVGFSAEVSLGDNDRMLQSEDVALRVTYTDMETGEVLPLSDPPYLRGAVASDYRKVRSDGPERYQWIPPYSRDANGRVRREHGPSVALPSMPPGKYLARQKIVLESSGSGPLFSAYPVFQIASLTDPRLRFDPALQQLQLRGRREAAESRRQTQYTYVTAVGGFVGAVQRDITPRVLLAEAGADEKFDFQQRMNLLEHPTERLEGLQALAKSIVENVPADQALRRAKLIEHHFRLSGKYFYSLNQDTVARRDDLDPNEDFVLNQRTGNCRNYASAMVMMLRSLGIPARVVSGYKGGEFNSVGQYFLVKQKHAHAWVEAYLEPEQIPEYALDDPSLARSGAWLRLDPTPEDEADQGLLADIGVLDQVGEVLDYMQLLWNDYVVQLNKERQEEAIFEPLLDGSLETAKNMTSAQAWKSIFESLAARLGLAPDGWFARHWYLWVLAVALPLGALGLWFGWWHGPNLWRMLFAGGKSDEKRRRRGESVDFYTRLEALLARHGHTRGIAQTAREFAVLVGAQLVETPPGREAAALLRQLVERFYGVRYGGQTLDAAKREEIARMLAKLERTLESARPPALAGA